MKDYLSHYSCHQGVRNNFFTIIAIAKCVLSDLHIQLLHVTFTTILCVSNSKVAI